MTNPADLPADDPRRHARQARERLAELIAHLRQDAGKVAGPRAEALVGAAAEVLGGLATAVADFGQGDEPAWRPGA